MKKLHLAYDAERGLTQKMMLWEWSSKLQVVVHVLLQEVLVGWCRPSLRPSSCFFQFWPFPFLIQLLWLVQCHHHHHKCTMKPLYQPTFCGFLTTFMFCSPEFHDHQYHPGPQKKTSLVLVSREMTILIHYNALPKTTLYHFTIIFVIKKSHMYYSSSKYQRELLSSSSWTWCCDALRNAS